LSISVAEDLVERLVQLVVGIGLIVSGAENSLQVIRAETDPDRAFWVSISKTSS
jgi:hypothetical protein